MNKSRLMIVMGEYAWTLAAVHLACAIARRSDLEVVLVKMVPVRNPIDLGTSAGLLDFSTADTHTLEEMVATAEDYGICLPVQLFQYASYWSGVVDAAKQLKATAVIAQNSSSFIPYLRDLRRWWLGRRLEKHHQLFFTLDDLKPTISWTPSITLQNNIAYSIEQHQLGEQL